MNEKMDLEQMKVYIYGLEACIRHIMEIMDKCQYVISASKAVEIGVEYGVSMCTVKSAIQYIEKFEPLYLGEIPVSHDESI